MASDEADALLRWGVQAAQAGDKKKARDLFIQALRKNPRSELAWMWMVSVVETEKERRFCLRKILEVNPDNQRARQALAQMQQPAPAAQRPLLSRYKQPPPPPAPAHPPHEELPALELDLGQAAEEAKAEADAWSAWPEPEFESVEASHAAATAEAKPAPGRGRRRLRLVLLFLLTVAMIVLAVVVLVPRFTSGGEVAATATPTAPLEEEPSGENITPLTEETTNSGAPALTERYTGNGYRLAYPEGWTVAVRQETEALTQVSLSRGTVDISAGPLPDAFAFAIVDVFPADRRTPAEMLAEARAVATEMTGVPVVPREIASGATTIGGRAGAFDYYVVSAPAPAVYVYAAAAALDDRGFVFMLFSTDASDRLTAEAMLESVVFEGAS